MEGIIHRGIAKAHFKIAQEYNKLFVGGKDGNEKKINRVVAAQNYFYAAIHPIEAIFVEKLEQHSFNHENRYRKLIENQHLFSDEVVSLFKKVDRDERNKVAYRGENGPMYEDIKKLATLLVDTL